MYWNTYTYDDLDRVTQENSQTTGITQSDYDSLKVVVTNELGQTNTEKKNAVGWTMWTEDDDSQRITFDYDSRGNLTKVTDPASNEKLNVYNLLDQKIQMVDPDMGDWRYEYNV